MAGGIGKHGGIVQGTEHHQHQSDAQQETKIADAIYQKGFEVGVNRCFLGIPKANQQIGNHSHRFPAEEQLHEIVGHHQHQHGEGE